MSAGVRIKNRRLELGLSQRKLGQRCNISGSAVAQWESEQTNLSSDSLMLVAKALETTPEWIMTGESRSSQVANDRKFSKFVDDNLHYLSDEQRQDIEKLINHAKERQEILKKYE